MRVEGLTHNFGAASMRLGGWGSGRAEFGEERNRLRNLPPQIEF